MISIFDIFKYSIGPSSSHTAAPMSAGYAYRQKILNNSNINSGDKLKVELYGSLSYTGKGHMTDKAIMLGLIGYNILNKSIKNILEEYRKIESLNYIQLNNCKLNFDLNKDIIYNNILTNKKYSNAMKFYILKRNKRYFIENYYSIGGGFILTDIKDNTASNKLKVKFKFNTCSELIAIANKRNLNIWKIILENEMCSHSLKDIRDKISDLWKSMNDSISRGLKNTGYLPGSLKIKRRASSLYKSISKKNVKDPLLMIDMINVYAIAVNEENASGGQIITAPTNGAAGIIPAVIKYYVEYIENSDFEGILRFFLTAGAIGILYKKNASISGADVGCQGEVGVASSMAAAGLVAALNGSNQEIENAAEIAMEHNLGLTCDPIKGLVQIPCIERNAMGAIKSINASRIAMNGKGNHKVSLDQVINTMFQTGKDMQSIYKETSLGGLAVNVVEC